MRYLLITSFLMFSSTMFAQDSKAPEERNISINTESMSFYELVVLLQKDHSANNVAISMTSN